MAFEIYSSIKDHFDKIILGGHPLSNGLEPIRDTYEKMISAKIPQYDIYWSSMEIRTNKINSIFTLVSVDEKYSIDKLSYGLMPYSTNLIGYCNILPPEVRFMKIGNNATKYIRNIYHTIESIAEFDDLYDSSNKSPHCIFLRAMPIYLTFHHINTVAPYAIDEYEDEFIRLCNKLTTDESAGYDMFHYMKQNRFYRSEEDIYRILTVDNTIKLL